jgi:L-lactate permease
MERWAWFLSGIAAGWLVAWVIIGVIVIGEIFLLEMLGLRGSERREELA